MADAADLQPDWNALDKTPQLRWLSDNVCPNAGPTFLTELGVCSPYSMTMWGFCVACWDADRIPAAWQRKIAAVPR